MGPRLFNRVSLLLVLSGAVLLLPGRPAAAEGEAGHGGWETCLHGKLEHFEASSLAWNEDTGLDLRNFPPDRVVDLVHMKLDMRFEDLNDARFTATETLRMSPLGRPTKTLTLNAVGLEIDAVRHSGGDVDFYQDDETVTMSFDPPLAFGREHGIEIDYVCDHPVDGIFFTPSSPAAPGYTSEVHTQGQTESNRHWFIGRDFPNERMTTELLVDVPAGFAVSSNGRLVSQNESGDRAQWHWLQDKPHVAYLVTLVIGQFDIVEIPHDRVPMKVWVPVGLGDHVMQTYGRTGEMIDVFERRLGIAYPWDRYDQLVVKNFRAGGMENTSATSMYPTAILDERALLDGDLDGLIAHELAHQWTGDMITCRSWAHIWLNEGWATFGSALWFEHRDGQDGYLDTMRRSFGVARRDRTTDEVPMVSPVYKNAWETFRRRANPYPKGSSILHMLRMMLGEEAFWNGVALYMNRHAMGLVETNDFRYAMEEVSGRGLEWFFEQWCYRPGAPNLEVAVRFEPQASQLQIDVEQVQHIDERTPAFRFTLPVHVLTAGGEQVLEIDVTEKSTSFNVALADFPKVVAVDPYLHVLKKMTVDKPARMWATQARQGPSIIARHQALDALGESDTPENVALLVAMIRDDTLRYTLRNSAVAALRKYGSEQAKAELLALFQEGVDEARVRATLTGAARDLEKDDVVDRLAEIASTDPSYDTRVAAIGALAQHEAKDQVDVIVTQVHESSQHEKVRGAALRALVKLDEPQGLELAVQYSAYGNTDRARATAIGVVGDLASHDQDAAVEYLLTLLDDPEPRARDAAISALAKTADERAETPLKAIADTHRSEAYRDRAERALETLRENMAKAEGEEKEDADDAG